jgi:hypothetical protein
MAHPIQNNLRHGLLTLGGLRSGLIINRLGEALERARTARWISFEPKRSGGGIRARGHRPLRIGFHSFFWRQWAQ